MAATAGRSAIKTSGARRSAPGSVKTDWVVAHANTTAADTTYLLDPLNASVSSNVYAVPIPDGATRVLIRQKFTVSSATPSTNAVVYLWVADENGIPTRIDNATESGTGVTLTVNNTATNSAKDSSGTFYYGDLPSLEGYDCLGGKTLYVLVATASNHSSATQQAVVAFLN